ncbi:MAG: serine hydrolase domain-containing protein [Gemmatimonadaceae bacterium]
MCALLLALFAVCGCASGTAQSSPGEISVSNAVQDSMRRVLDRAIADSAFPGAFAIAGGHDAVYASMGVGHLDWKQPSPVPDDGTIWDMASLTKIIGMTTAMMQLWADHRVDLDAPVQRYLPAWSGPGKERVMVRHLLTHSSGLPAWRPLYKESTTAAEAMTLVYATPLDTVPGARMVYSDLGAILLGQIVERVSGQRLDSYLVDHVFRPLGMSSTMYRPDSSLLSRIAPTEFDPWRQRHVHGEVHDENAFALGGISAHAGLFSSGHDMARYARMILNGGTLDGARILTPEAIATFTRVQDSALSNRALGWEVPNGQNSAGHRLSAHAFGHTGFTGTSLWIDPDRDLYLVLLSNRVNPTRENRRIGGVRTALADAVSGALAASRPAGLTSSSPTAVRP